MELRAIAVLGPYRGGTSMVTGLLQSLGCFAGDHFFNAYTGYCTFESEFLRRCCLRCFDEREGRWCYLGTFDERVAILREWSLWASGEARKRSCPAVVGKHPSMCKLVDELTAAWNSVGLEPMKFVRVDRAEHEVLASWRNARSSTGMPWWPRKDIEIIVHDLITARDISIGDRDVVQVDFDLLRLDPQNQIAKLATACGLSQQLVDKARVLVREPAATPITSGRGDVLPHAANVEDVDNRLARHRKEMTRSIRDAEILRRGPVPSRDAILLVMVVFNEHLRLPDTLRHYRELGVGRFAIIDNQSSDETREFLLAQPDVDLYGMAADFRNSIGGCGWGSALIHEYYGVDRWVISSDADEQLVYDGCERRNLKQLVRHLNSAGRESLPTVMVDMYSATSIASSVLLDGQRLLDRCPYFDEQGYSRTQFPRSVPVPRVTWSGGPSQRLFGVEGGWLAKVPLVFWRADTWAWNPHVAYPFELNFGEPTGALLHFKFLSDFHSVVTREVHRNQHARGAEKYRRFQHRLLQVGDLSLTCDYSRRYDSSRSLVNANFMARIDWSDLA